MAFSSWWCYGIGISNGMLGSGATVCFNQSTLSRSGLHMPGATEAVLLLLLLRLLVFVWQAWRWSQERLRGACGWCADECSMILVLLLPLQALWMLFGSPHAADKGGVSQQWFDGDCFESSMHMQLLLSVLDTASLSPGTWVVSGSISMGG